tara:strand:+ start:6286 stop:6549 length:264 start_codon:yes stop_codon:yes gene_type:complete
MALYDTSSVPNKIEPSHELLTITPSDTLELTHSVRAIFVGGTGNITLIDSKGTSHVLVGIPAGATLAIKPTKIMATGTTATSIVGLI